MDISLTSYQRHRRIFRSEHFVFQSRMLRRHLKDNPINQLTHFDNTQADKKFKKPICFYLKPVFFVFSCHCGLWGLAQAVFTRIGVLKKVRAPRSSIPITCLRIQNIGCIVQTSAYLTNIYARMILCLSDGYMRVFAGYGMLAPARKISGGAGIR